MAVKASAHITLSFLVDVKAVYRYYKLQASTASAPSVPSGIQESTATRPPSSDWSLAEPGYTSGSTNTLYFVDCTVFANDTFLYSNVSISSSYEAAKEAWNKADNAQQTADGAQTTAARASETATTAQETATTASSLANAAQEGVNTVNVTLTTLIRETSKGIEVGRIPTIESLSEGDSITLPKTIVNTDGSFDVVKVTYTNVRGVLTESASLEVASFGEETIIGNKQETHARIDSDSFDIVDASGTTRASLGGEQPMLEIGMFTWINRSNGNLTLRLNE